MKAAAFPVVKTIAEFDVTASSIPQATFGYLASLEWIRAAENYCAVGPTGTGKSHSLAAFGVAAVESGHRVRNFTAADIVETLYPGLADNSVGRVIENILRPDLVLIDEVGFALLDDTPSASSAASSTTPSSWSPKASHSACARPEPREEAPEPPELHKLKVAGHSATGGARRPGRHNRLTRLTRRRPAGQDSGPTRHRA
jgi:IstB-like ATP binding protein